MKRSRQRRPREYRFEGFRFVPDRQLLLHDERPVRIGSRAFDLLHLLVSRAGDVVSKEELTQFVWPDLHVHESNLKVTVAALRRALPRAPSAPPLIATIPGRGYRFAVPVRVLTEGAAADPPPSDAERDKILAALEARLVSAATVTVIGPADIGKTTLSIAAAQTLLQHYSGGVHFVDLAAGEAIGPPDPAIAALLRDMEGSADPVGALVDALRLTDMLVILHNGETGP